MARTAAGIMERLRKAQDSIRFIHVRHEEAAAVMACAYTKYTGRLGVCHATSGPGAVHLLKGLYDAKLDQAPMLANHWNDLPRPDRDDVPRPDALIPPGPAPSPWAELWAAPRWIYPADTEAACAHEDAS